MPKNGCFWPMAAILDFFKNQEMSQFDSFHSDTPPEGHFSLLGKIFRPTGSIKAKKLNYLIIFEFFIFGGVVRGGSWTQKQKRMSYSYVSRWISHFKLVAAMICQNFSFCTPPY